MFIGWADPVASPYEIINYYDSVVARGGRHYGSRTLHRHVDIRASLHDPRDGTLRALGDGATYFFNVTWNSSPPVEDAQHDWPWH